MTKVSSWLWKAGGSMSCHSRAVAKWGEEIT